MQLSNTIHRKIRYIKVIPIAYKKLFVVDYNQLTQENQNIVPQLPPEYKSHTTFI